MLYRGDDGLQPILRLGVEVGGQAGVYQLVAPGFADTGVVA